MYSSSGLSSNSSGLQNSGSEGDLKQLMDQRKRKRMISNRESARRSRLKKQKQLDVLAAQAAQLRKENQQILNGLNVTSQHYLNVEAENSILRAQAAELSHRLQSLNEIMSFMSAGESGFPAELDKPDYEMDELYGFVNNNTTWNSLRQPNMAWNCFCQPIAMTAASADTTCLY